MARRGKRYPEEYRSQLIELARSGRSAESLAREYEPSAESIRRWVAQADVDDGRKEGLTTEERDELRRLRRENHRLRQEREILKKAAAWFARESEATPKRRSRS